MPDDFEPINAQIFGTVTCKVSINGEVNSEQTYPQEAAALPAIATDLQMMGSVVSVEFGFDPPVVATVTKPLMTQLRELVERTRDDNSDDWVELATIYNQLMGATAPTQS